MDWTIVASLRGDHQTEHQTAFIEGLAVHGIPAVRANSAEAVRTKYAACWGWRAGKRIRAAGHEVVIMERGYLGDRFAWTSLAWNGLNNRGQVPAAPDDGGERFNRNFKLAPETDGGDYVLIIGQVPGDSALQGRDLYPWYCQQSADAKHNGLQARFRPHPLAAVRGAVKDVPGAPRLDGTLSEAIAHASTVVTFNSNAGVDARLAGRQATAADEGSMIWNMHDRTQWAHALAWRQWRIDEIRDGTALEHVLGSIAVNA